MMTMIENKRHLSFTSMIWNKGGAMMRNKRVIAGSSSRIHHPPLTQAIWGLKTRPNLRRWPGSAASS